MSAPPTVVQPFGAMPAYDRLPFVGQLRDFGRRPWVGAARLARDVGPLCRMSLPFVDMVVLNDPGAIAQVLEDDGGRFFKGAPGPALLPLATQASMFVQPGGEAWRRAREANPMARAVDAGWFEALLPGLEAMVTARVDRWVERTAAEPFDDTYDRLRQFTFDALCTSLFGEGFGDDTYREFMGLARWLDRRIKWPLPVQLPVTPWRRSAMGRYMATLEAAITRRGTGAEDGAADLRAFAARDGLQAPPAVLAAQLNALIFSGAFSLASAIAATLHELSRRPALLARVRDAVDALFAAGPLTLARLRACGPLQGAFLEALRLRPPVALFVRQVDRRRDAELGGYRVPAGATLLISCKHLHVAPDHWEAPLHFRPERWTPERIASDPAGSGHFFPFGRGPRACYAQGYAELLVPLTVALVLRRTHPEVGLDRPWRSAFWFGCMVPDRLPSRFRPRAAP